MSECMISTPNLEGGASSSDLVSSWTIFFISGGARDTSTTKELPFQVKHLYFLAIFGEQYREVKGSMDLADGGTLQVIMVGGHTASRITLQDNIVTSFNQQDYAADMIFYFIAVPA